MTFKKAIWLPVFIYDEEEIRLNEMGLGNDDDGFNETEQRAFWNIDWACKDSKMKNVTAFTCNGDSFYTPIGIEEFVKMIDKHLQL